MEIYVETDYAGYQVKFWLTDKRGDKRCYYHFDGSNVVETMVEEPQFSSTLKPFLTLPFSFAKNFIEVIANHANNTGVKTEKRDFLEGKLIATEEHLKDLQKAFNKLLEKQ